MLKPPLVAAAFGMALAAMPITANAGTRSIQVEYKDLDLSSAEGQKTLDRRIERAANEICEVNAIRTGTRVRSQASLQCVKEARSAVSAQVAAKIEKSALGG